jgi:hypothetical protein
VMSRLASLKTGLGDYSGLSQILSKQKLAPKCSGEWMIVCLAVPPVLGLGQRHESYEEL